MSRQRVLVRFARDVDSDAALARRRGSVIKVEVTRAGDAMPSNIDNVDSSTPAGRAGGVPGPARRCAGQHRPPGDGAMTSRCCVLGFVGERGAPCGGRRSRWSASRCAGGDRRRTSPLVRAGARHRRRGRLEPSVAHGGFRCRGDRWGRRASRHPTRPNGHTGAARPRPAGRVSWKPRGLLGACDARLGGRPRATTRPRCRCRPGDGPAGRCGATMGVAGRGAGTHRVAVMARAGVAVAASRACVTPARRRRPNSR